MALFRVIKTYRSLLRLREIAVVLSRHGFGHLIGRLGLREHLPFLFRPRGPQIPVRFLEREETIARRLRLAFQDLGPTFVKLGQILSGRPDLIPQEFIDEFVQLQDRVGPFPSDQARQIVEEDIEGPFAAAFRSFEEPALASGSIGQAHAAVLADGTPVIAKIRRPEVERIVLTDLYILQYLAGLAERYIPEIKIFRPVMMVEELGRTLRKEIDFLTEASTTKKFQEAFEKHPMLRIPRVYWEYSSSRVLVLERISGFSIGETERLDRLSIDRKELAATLSSAFMVQYFQTGLFHADPHPGNILVSEDGEIGLIDFGMVGVLSRELKGHLARIVLALVRGDMRRILTVAGEIGVLSDETRIEELEPDLSDYVDKYFAVPLNRIETHELFTELMKIVQTHHLFVPRDFVLLGKSLVTVIGVCQALDPDFNLAEAARPHFTRLLLARLSPLSWARSLSGSVSSFLTPLWDVPRELRFLLRRLNSGQLTTALRHDQIEVVTRAYARAQNRLGLSIVLAATILATGLVLREGVHPYIGWALLAISGGLALVLAAGMARSGQV
ncbi:MAG: phosphotransferase [Planctomycetes bacterium]|nr:phosphotransferase [Planctomycetota bacterium]